MLGKVLSFGTNKGSLDKLEMTKIINKSLSFWA